MPNLQGHEFATQDEIKTLYGHSLGAIELYGLPYNETTIAVGFTEAGLRQLANEHVDALQLEKMMGLAFGTEEAEINYEWPHSGDKVQFLGQHISLAPPAEDSEWEQHRTKQSSGLFRNPDPDQRMLAALFSGQLEGQLGTANLLSYEAAALQGIMMALTTANPDQVRAMMCNPDDIGY